MSDTTLSPRVVRAALAGSIGLVVLGAVAFWAATQQLQPATTDAVQVTVTAAGCEPSTLSVPAGAASFHIINQSDRPLEWEILDGVLVLAERENILPGYSATLATRLKPGSYQITCGLLTNPKGALNVTPSTESEAARTAPPTREFIGPLSEYRVFAVRQANGLAQTTLALRDAIASGDVAASRAAWQAARLNWVRLAPLAAQNADLAARMDMRPDEIADDAHSDAFIGFHRIEAGLWRDNSTAGLAPIAEALAADAETLKSRLSQTRFQPADLANLSARRAQVWAETGTRNNWAGLSPDEATARAEGVMRPLSLIAPFVTRADAAKGAALQTAMDHLTAAPASSEALAALAVIAGTINAQLGLE